MTEEQRELETRIQQLDAKQQSIKIYLNSIYGYFGNKQAPIGDDDIASSITLTGQAIIKRARDIGFEFVKKNCTRSDLTLEHVAIYNDTDSCFFSLQDIPIEFFRDGSVTDEAHEYINALNNEINTDINKWCKKAFNSKDCRILFKREKICDVGLFLEKKRYVVHILDEEGIGCNKWKYTGVEIARTTMPKPVKSHVKRIIETMLSTQSQSKTNVVVSEAYDIFKTLPIEDIAINSGIKIYEKYASKCHEFKVAKGVPMHVKASYFYNLLLEKMNLAGKYEKITSGDKIKMYRVQEPNKYGIQAIAFKYALPEELKTVLPIDRETMFEKIVFSVVERFYQAVNWTPRKPSQQVQLELDDLFGN